MPVTISASRALRKDRARTITNIRRKRAVKQAIDTMKATANPENLSRAVSQIDRTVKHHIITKNKAARLKAQLTKLLQTTSSSPVKPAKKSK